MIPSRHIEGASRLAVAATDAPLRVDNHRRAAVGRRTGRTDLDTAGLRAV